MYERLEVSGFDIVYILLDLEIFLCFFWGVLVVSKSDCGGFPSLRSFDVVLFGGCGRSDGGEKIV